jgi:hypothetical protein
MEKLRIFFSAISWLVSIAVGLAILYTFVPDSPNLESLAKTTACGESAPSCNAFTVFLERSSVARSYRFFTRGREVAVHCERRYLVAGDYSCVRSSEGPLPVDTLLAVLATSAEPSAPPPPGGSAAPAVSSGTPARKRPLQPHTAAATR